MMDTIAAVSLVVLSLILYKRQGTLMEAVYTWEKGYVSIREDVHLGLYFHLVMCLMHYKNW